MTIKDEIITEIQKGRAGNNQGLSMGLPKLESIIDGVCQETYTLIISNSGAGKTSYALYAYLYKPLMATINNDNFKVLYFSLEMNRMSLFVKLLSIYIFETFGIQLSFKKILSRERGYILDDDSYELVMKCMPWIESISEKVEIIKSSLFSFSYDKLKRIHFPKTLREIDMSLFHFCRFIEKITIDKDNENFSKQLRLKIF